MCAFLDETPYASAELGHAWVSRLEDNNVYPLPLVLVVALTSSRHFAISAIKPIKGRTISSIPENHFWLQARLQRLSQNEDPKSHGNSYCIYARVGGGHTAEQDLRESVPYSRLGSSVRCAHTSAGPPSWEVPMLCHHMQCWSRRRCPMRTRRLRVLCA